MRMLLAIVLATGVHLAAAGDEPLDWKAVLDELRAAVSTADDASLAATAERLADGAAEPVAWRAYWRGYIAWRRSHLAGDEDDLKARLEDCATAMATAIERGETSGESHALLGGCYGRLAGTGAMAGMRYGGKSQAALDEALLEAPDNPRVLLQAGISDLHTPIQYGGDPERAVRRLRQARQLLAGGEAAGQPWQPRWGRVDATGHLALALMKLERPDDALEVLREAGRRGLTSKWLTRIAQRIEANVQ